MRFHPAAQFNPATRGECEQCLMLAKSTANNETVARILEMTRQRHHLAEVIAWCFLMLLGAGFVVGYLIVRL